MTDRELLELAARAAGYVLGKHTQKDWAVTYRGMEWNPLTDDGDNAQLRRALRIVVQWFPTDVAAMHFGDDGRGRSWAEPYGKDPAAAERLAVVRAAAEIGRALE